MRDSDDAPRGECQGCGDDALLTQRVQGIGPCCEGCTGGEDSRVYPKPRQPEYVCTVRGEHFLVGRDTDEIVPLDVRPTGRDLARRPAVAVEAGAEVRRRELWERAVRGGRTSTEWCSWRPRPGLGGAAASAGGSRSASLGGGEPPSPFRWLCRMLPAWHDPCVHEAAYFPNRIRAAVADPAYGRMVERRPAAEELRRDATRCLGQYHYKPHEVIAPQPGEHLGSV